MDLALAWVELLDIVHEDRNVRSTGLRVRPLWSRCSLDILAKFLVLLPCRLLLEIELESRCLAVVLAELVEPLLTTIIDQH